MFAAGEPNVTISLARDAEGLRLEWALISVRCASDRWSMPAR
jgi:hypothetical protein